MNACFVNATMRYEFYISALPNGYDLWYILFAGVLLLFLMTIFGNLLIIVLICTVPHLHTPMYFFLCNLSVQDLINVSSIFPKLMDIILTGDHRISFLGCFTQMFMFVVCTETELFLLTSMAYDRYVAICTPLQYSVIMNFQKCSLMASACWIFSSLNTVMHCFLMSQLQYCHLKAINHFFCDVRAMLKLTVDDTTHIKTIIFVECALFGCIPFVLILTSYMYIISTICKIRSTTGRLKTFSSCTSHIVTVILFFGASLSQYMKSESGESEEQDKLLSILYVALIPMLNPLVYSLRNKDVLLAMKKITKVF